MIPTQPVIIISQLHKKNCTGTFEYEMVAFQVHLNAKEGESKSNTIKTCRSLALTLQAVIEIGSFSLENQKLRSQICCHSFYFQHEFICEDYQLKDAWEHWDNLC